MAETTNSVPSMVGLDRISSAIDECGFVVIPGVLSTEEQQRLTAAFEDARQSQSAVRRASFVYAVRHVLLSSVPIAEYTRSPSMQLLLSEALGASARPVKCILFDKIPHANWKVTWHQDKTISVKQRIDTPGFGPWSTKAGVVHVQPSVEVMERILAVRVHLDHCDADNGALKVIPGSHRLGYLSSDQVAEHVEGNEHVTVEVPARGVVLMHPLVLHSSSQSSSPQHRRVIHVEYSASDLPSGLEWHEA